MKILCDFHHSSLLKSLRLLFEDRLGHELYRPIGLEWFSEGFWDVYPSPDTAKQFLSLDQTYIPSDGTPALNQIASNLPEGSFLCFDPGGDTFHKACTLDYFKNNEFGLVIASLPQHIDLFRRLITSHNKSANLVLQVGNNWHWENYDVEHVLSSTAPRKVPHEKNVVFYHQEVDQRFFTPSPAIPTKNIYSFVNILQQTGIGWDDFQKLERLTETIPLTWQSFGGQCRDGNRTGDRELATTMREAALIFHVKPGGDGFGHILHDAYSVGRPVITRGSHYRGQLGEKLLKPGTFIDLDLTSHLKVALELERLMSEPDRLLSMGKLARQRFEEVIDYTQEAQAVKAWLERM